MVEKMLHFLVLVLCTLNCAISVDMPNYMRACSRSDPNLNTCALKSARAALHQFSLGDPSRGLPPLDPLYVAQMTAFVPNEQGLKIVFKGNNFTGLSEMFLEDLQFDLDKKIISAKALTTLEVKNTYDLSGRMLVIPIKSNGDSHIRLKNTFLHIRYWYEHIKGADGQIYWKIYDQDVTYEVEKATFRLENLLNDKILGDQLNRLLNQMSRKVVDSVGPYICKSLSTAVADNIGIFLSQIPYDVLMPE